METFSFLPVPIRIELRIRKIEKRKDIEKNAGRRILSEINKLENIYLRRVKEKQKLSNKGKEKT